MAMSYYERQNVVHLDGTRVFHKPEDDRAEHEVAAVLGAAWQCELRQFGALSPIDWYATRLGRMTGVLELKSRSHAFGTYPTVFLNVRKWLALQLASAGLGVPAIFVVKFTDGIAWAPLVTIDASAMRIGGCRELVKSRSDIEPVIDVPITILRTLRK
jgi:hypothetical protein